MQALFEIKIASCEKNSYILQNIEQIEMQGRP